MKLISVVGARPNFMKIAPFIKAIYSHNVKRSGGSIRQKVKHVLVHTGQHYDNRMNHLFFESLGIPDPDINLGIGSGSHAEQVGKTMMAFEKVIKKERPDWVVVVGDVNATLACSITSKKENVNCCHIEAGLRSGDMTMPEEINRILTDRVSDLLLTPDTLSSENLRREGISENKIRCVGNIMIDTLEENRHVAEKRDIQNILSTNLLNKYQTIPSISKNHPYALITMHRPSNVDDEKSLKSLINFFVDEVAKIIPIIWPMHPRTLKQLKKFNLWAKLNNTSNVSMLHPIDYLDMLRLNMDARILFTDSGGLQEESLILGTPCLTLRWNTERPITLREHGGTSILVGNDVDKIRLGLKELLHEKIFPRRPDLWDGQTAQRCLKEILTAK